ncbi:DASS family sodium-coupled anion symporter [Halanaerobium sp. Z-7514]|uniref:Sodium-dependent dicarboxylate transporter SdcS n=1 Tax=Halanaerobium polyolivorans TaxID=2886943 RepID=A0AAW4X1K9_9FIRM|nr:DASS family sodium-coupled anion symporter [Halanaerobium polyolivorans]
MHYIKNIIKYTGIIIFILLLALPTFEGLSPEGQRALAVFVLIMTFWLTNIMPLAITSLLGMALMPLLNIMSVDNTFALFGNKAIFFILGALIISAALYYTGLGSRMAFSLIKVFGNTPRKLLAGTLLTAALMSCLMPEHAVAALLFPIVMEIALSLELKPLESSYGKLLFLSMAWGAIIGGITTYLGGSRNLLAVSILEQQYNMSIGFFEWIKYSWPIPTLMLLFFIFLIWKYFKIELDNIDKAYQVLEEKLAEKGSLSFDEKKLIATLALIIFSWLFLAQIIHISVTAVIGAVLIFVLKIVAWREIEEYVNWGIIIMYGGAIVVATSLVETGATAWLSNQIFSRLDLSIFWFLALLALFTILLTEGVSNVAAVAVILPIAFSISDIYQLNPIIITLSVALPGGLAFMFPMGTPPNAIAFSSGYYKIEDSVKLGIILNIAGWFVYILVLKFYWPLLGLTF